MTNNAKEPTMPDTITDETLPSPEVSPDVVAPPTPAPDADALRKVREEAASNRVKAKATVAEANARLLAATIRADGRLVDPDVLQLSDDMPGDDGWLDEAKVAEAIGQRIADKPYLATPTPRTVIAQGARETPPGLPSLSALIRERL